MNLFFCFGFVRKQKVKDKNLKDFGYYKKLSLSEQKEVNKKVDEINELIQVKKPYRFMLILVQ